ncbi:MAG TPA: glutamate-5-semialdehyde dehydrogenase [Methylomirabilota bacterium]|nr:glutamate-5-semialdehyde dehydrogenase [Methylomirabilota bacterium]
MDAAAHVETKAKAAKEASRVLALASTRVKNEALGQMARGLEERTGAILDANRHDLERARTAGHARAFVERLTLTEGRVEEMAAGLRHVAGLPDPVGETVETIRRPSGLEIARVRVPLGVIGFIYESRPNVTADAAGLCLKSGNAVLLRGGSEALESNTLLAQILGKAVEKAGLPPEVIQAVETADRAGVMAMLTLDRYLDLIIPRGGEEFVRLVAERATVPVLKHDKGLCHLYVDDGADLDMALAVTINAKAQRVSVCNSLETLLVHAAIAPALLPRLAARLAEVPVEVRADERARALMPGARAAEAADWDAEYLDYILAVRVVEDLDEAVAHIRRHGSGLAESIVTRDVRRARRFTQEVDAAAVLVNASTRLVDGSQFGMGAEMGISTSRVHARGPVGVRELTTTKFVVWGDGHIRE